ncbi:MAG: TolC family protein, partial [Stenotrophomonas sp.]
MKISPLFPFVPAVRPLALACTTVLLLSACVSTGQYKVDPPSVPAVYGRGDAQRNAPTEASDAVPTLRADVRDDAWWTGFGDPRLDRVIDRALQANTDLASAGLAVQRARLQAGLSDNALWPQPSGSVGSSGNRPIDQSADWNRSSSAGVSLQWEIDLWGRLRAQRDIAQWEAQASEEDLQNTALLVIGDVATQYWTLAYLN